ncbi:unnamed protein product [Arctogadus glacialis]
MAACPPCSSEADLMNRFGPDLLVVRGSAWTSKGLDLNRGHSDDPGPSLGPWGDVRRWEGLRWAESLVGGVIGKREESG